MSDFYNNNQEENQEEAPSKIKLGEKEYSEEELSKLVGLGEMANELETKWNSPINKLMPEFVKKTQRLAELEPEYQSLKKRVEEEENAKAQSDDALTPDKKELARKAILDILGYEPMNKKEFDQLYASRRQGEQLLSDAEATLEEAKELGKPQATVERLLEHMSTTGIKNPEKAYKDLFEPELEKWKEQQLLKAKPSGFPTQSSSTAGAKNPQPVRITKDNLKQMLEEVVRREA